MNIFIPSGQGAAINVQNCNSSLYLLNNDFFNMSASLGGALYLCVDRNMYIYDDCFTSCFAAKGRAIYFLHQSTNSFVDLDMNSFNYSGSNNRNSERDEVLSSPLQDGSTSCQ